MLITRSRQLLSLAAWIVLLLAVLYLHVMEFVLTFCLGGFIPGTDIEISALTAMYISCAAVIGIGYLSLIHVRAANARRRRYYSMRRPVVARQSRIFAFQTAPRDARETARTRQLVGLGPALRLGLLDTFNLVTVLALEASVRAAKCFCRISKAVWRRIIAPLRAVDSWLDLQFRPVEEARS